MQGANQMKDQAKDAPAEAKAERDPFTRTISWRLTHAARLQKALSARMLAAVGLFPGQEAVLKLLAEADGRTMGIWPRRSGCARPRRPRRWRG